MWPFGNRSSWHEHCLATPAIGWVDFSHRSKCRGSIPQEMRNHTSIYWWWSPRLSRLRTVTLHSETRTAWYRMPSCLCSGWACDRWPFLGPKIPNSRAAKRYSDSLRQPIHRSRQVSVDPCAWAVHWWWHLVNRRSCWPSHSPVLCPNEKRSACGATTKRWPIDACKAERQPPSTSRIGKCNWIAMDLGLCNKIGILNNLVETKIEWCIRQLTLPWQSYRCPDAVHSRTRTILAQYSDVERKPAVCIPPVSLSDLDAFAILVSKPLSDLSPHRWPIELLRSVRDPIPTMLNSGYWTVVAATCAVRSMASWLKRSANWRHSYLRKAVETYTFRRASSQWECIAIERVYHHLISMFSIHCDSTQWYSYLSSTLCNPSWREPTSDLSLPSIYLYCIRSHIAHDCCRWWELSNRSCIGRCRIDWTQSTHRRHCPAVRCDLWWDERRHCCWPTHYIWMSNAGSITADSVRFCATGLWHRSNFGWHSWAQPSCPLGQPHLVCETQSRVQHYCCCWCLCCFQLWPNFESQTRGLCSRKANRNFSMTENVVFLYGWRRSNVASAMILVRRIPTRVSFRSRPMTTDTASSMLRLACPRLRSLSKFYRGYSSFGREMLTKSLIDLDA